LTRGVGGSGSADARYTVVVTERGRRGAGEPPRKTPEGDQTMSLSPRLSLRVSVAALLLAGAGLGLPGRVSLRAALQQPVFRAGVDHVAVDVIATDSHDQPVSDLKQEDFQISEGGRPQTIADFEHVSIPVAHRAIAAGAAAMPVSDVAENTQPAADSRAFVMIVDDVHILPALIVPVKRAMTEFLQTLSPRDEVAVVFVGRSDLSQNFTTDVSRLLKTVDNVRAALAFGLGADAILPPPPPPRGGLGPQPPVPPLSGPPNICSPTPKLQIALQAARSATFDLRNAAATLANSGHARRAIIYVSGQSVLDPGAPIQCAEFTAANAYREDLLAAFDQARRSDVPIYTLDPRGLAQPETATVGHCCSSYQQRAEIQRRILLQQDYLASIATNTGGRFFINQNDLAHAIDQIVSENGSYYLLGYYPDPFIRDGTFHNLKVTVTRPDVRVRSRPGYTAPLAGAPAATAKSTLTTTMSAGFNVSGLSLRAFAAPVAPTEKGMSVVVTTEITYPSVVAGPVPSEETLHWEVLALDPDGKIKGSVEHAAPVSASAAGSRFVLNDVLDLPMQPLTIRVGASSEALGKAGSVQLLIDVPNVSSSKLLIGGVILGVVGASGEPAAEPTNLKALVPFQPTTSRTFAATDTLQVFAPLFWASRDAAAHAVVSVRRGADVVAHQETDAQSAVTRGDHRTATARSDLSLSGLAAGPYTLNLDVQLPDGQTAARTVPFAIKNEF
jgi:VWFA-related protein